IINSMGISTVKGSQKEISGTLFANVEDLLTLKAIESDRQMVLLMMMTVSERGDKELWHQNIKGNAEQISRIIEKLLERNKNEPIMIRRLEELNTVRLAFRETRDTQLIPLIYDEKIEEAKKITLGIQAERFNKMISITKELVTDAGREARHKIAELEKGLEQFIRFLAYIGILAILSGVIITLFMNRILSKPLIEISAVAERISSGNLAVNIPSYNRQDEVGILSQAFRKMVEGIKRQNSNIVEAVAVIASSSNEIAATTAQLAASTEETATAVAQTTTTVEEVRQTANLSTQKAKYVSDTAQNTLQVSQTGAKVVNETIEGINRMREQMASIAESIVKLSEYNQAISEIIATVDDIADQSNLLSVNASIEAAKAGEQGKGFIVLAQEIKGLAEQSKLATKKVRTILNDIQRSTNAAVMATEKGSKEVEATVKQSIEAGNSIQSLSKAIAEASQASMQIAASCNQQLVGVDQVTLAMTNIKQATTQNAASTKQVEITMRTLQESGQKLSSLLEYYKG
ncbi:MAG: methyl-accepting chemotaxis protein, partial [Nitrospinae bacterium]|nr:methyl-accepting chemotaxis protein [Nitrospinota bacterium]